HDDLIYIMNDANDRVLLVDESLLPLYERIAPHVSLDHVLVMSKCAGGGEAFLDYETVLASADPAFFTPPDIDEHEAAAMCYTWGPTCRPKGVLYSPRAMVLHSFAEGLRDSLGVGEDDTILPIVPMFHVNAWGLPFTATLFGSNQVLPGPYLDPAS